MRYVKQRDPTACGPYALLNALKWAGHDVTFEGDFRRLASEVRFKRAGTHIDDMRRALARYFDVTSMWSLSVADVRRHIAAGGSVVLYYRQLADDFHYTNIVAADDDGTFTAVNVYSDATTMTLTADELRGLISRKYVGARCTVGFFIDPKGKRGRRRRRCKARR